MKVVLVFVAIAALLAAEAFRSLILYHGRRRQEELRRRLRALERGGAAGLIKGGRMARSRWLERVLRPLPAAQALERLLLQTDLRWTVADLVTASLLLAGGLASVGFVVLFRNPIVAAAGFAVGAIVPTLTVLGARARRNRKLSEQLPDALEMMVRALRAGHGLTAGLQLVATEMPVPIAIEFGRCFEEQQLGMEFRAAVQNLAERAPNNLDLKIFAVSLIIQHETGGNLVEVLEKIAQTLRERFKFYGKLRALTAEGRYSGLILGALPFGSALLIAIIKPGYLLPLFMDTLGRFILGGSILIWALGLLWMRRLVRVEF